MRGPSASGLHIPSKPETDQENPLPNQNNSLDRRVTGSHPARKERAGLLSDIAGCLDTRDPHTFQVGTHGGTQRLSWPPCWDAEAFHKGDSGAEAILLSTALDQ